MWKQTLSFICLALLPNCRTIDKVSPETRLASDDVENFVGISIQGAIFEEEGTNRRLVIGDKDRRQAADEIAYDIQMIRDGDIIERSGMIFLMQVIDRVDVLIARMDNEEYRYFYDHRKRVLIARDSGEIYKRVDRNDIKLITFKITSLPTVAGLESGDEEGLVMNAFGNWRRVGNILLRRRDESRTPNLEFITVSRDPACDCVPSTKQGPPTQGTIQIQLDKDRNWDKTSFVRHVTHELGLAFGLGVSADPTSVMHDPVQVDALSADDKERIIAIYGPAPQVGTDTISDEEFRTPIEGLLRGEK